MVIISCSRLFVTGRYRNTEKVANLGFDGDADLDPVERFMMDSEVPNVRCTSLSEELAVECTLLSASVPFEIL